MTMPPMLYGTAWKQDQTARLVMQALQAGFQGIDTACQPKHYNEAQVGEGIVSSGVARENIFIQTKFTPIAGQDPKRVPYDPSLPLDAQVAMSFKVSQNNLHVKTIDSYLLHSSMMPMQALMQIWRAMEKISDEGGAKQIGLSNCYDIQVLKRLYDEARVKPSVVQNRFYDESGYDVEIRKFCKENTIAYQSFWSLTANPHVLNSSQLNRAAQKYAKSNEQIFYRFLIQIGITPLNGTTSLQHMNEDVDIFDFSLDSSEVDEISLLLRV
ncbi:MAG: aldo/keto reductase [Campylobacterota bacterium]|nr:aldo/keto reductase [Campylobacterota bacterium]